MEPDSPILVPASERTSEMDVGIGSYCLTWAIGVDGYPVPENPMTETGLLELAAQLGVKRVQFADNMPLQHLDVATLKRLSSRAERAGITLEVGTRGSDPSLLMSYLDIASNMKAKLVRTLLTEPDLEKCRADLEQVLPAYSSAGVAIALENHGMHTSGELADLILSMDTRFLGCCLDTVNSFGSLEGPGQVIRNLAPHAICLHLKDFVILRHPHRMGFEITGAPAGQGRLNIPLLCAAVKSAAASAGRPEPGIVLESWVPWQGSTAETIRLERSWLEKSLDWLRALHTDDMPSQPSMID
jgi:3-oxoisoapionate decarboxylase